MRLFRYLSAAGGDFGIPLLLWNWNDHKGWNMNDSLFAVIMLTFVKNDVFTIYCTSHDWRQTCLVSLGRRLDRCHEPQHHPFYSSPLVTPQGHRPGDVGPQGHRPGDVGLLVELLPPPLRWSPPPLRCSPPPLRCPPPPRWYTRFWCHFADCILHIVLPLIFYCKLLIACVFFLHFAFCIP